MVKHLKNIGYTKFLLEEFKGKQKIGNYKVTFPDGFEEGRRFIVYTQTAEESKQLHELLYDKEKNTIVVRYNAGKFGGYPVYVTTDNAIQLILALKKLKDFDYKKANSDTIQEASEDEYATLLDKVMTLLDTVVGDRLVYVQDNGKKVVNISGENYVISDMNGKVIKTQKIYKDGEVTNYDLGVQRLKDFIQAIKNEQFVQ